MSLLLLFNQPAGPIAPPSQVVGGWLRSDGYSKREIDRAFEEWKRIKAKNARRIVKKAVEVIEEVRERPNLLDALPVQELVAAVTDISARPDPVLLEQIKAMTAQVQALADEEDEDDIMLMVWALN